MSTKTEIREFNMKCFDQCESIFMKANTKVSIFEKHINQNIRATWLDSNRKISTLLA